MAVTVTNQSNPLASKLVQDTAATNSEVANSTGASGTLFMVEIKLQFLVPIIMAHL